MIHLQALPGSALGGAPIATILQRAVDDARALEAGGADAVMVENFFDVPFPKVASAAHTIAAMTLAVDVVRRAVSLPVGVNVLRNDSSAAMGIAHLCGAQFIRVNVYVGAAITDQGLIEGAARETVQYRRELGADVAIWADVFVKHAAQLGQATIEDAARDAVERGLADALIVTGAATGAAANPELLERAIGAVPGSPVLVGSGFSAGTASLFAKAAGAVVGTSLKHGGLVENPVDASRVRLLRDAMRGG